MVWQVGIDEAGYGPNLGPLVMAVVACRVPDPHTNLWDRLAKIVRRHGEKDQRLLVADSKLVYTPGVGLCLLENAVLAFLAFLGTNCDVISAELSLLDLVSKVCANSLAEMKKEAWFHGNTWLPCTVAEDKLQRDAEAWGHATIEADLQWGPVAGVLVAAERFNGLIARWGSKGAVLGLALTELLGGCLELPGDEALEITVDKHGGRNFYSALLQHAFADGMVLAREEGADRSHYEVMGLKRPVRVTFQPRADQANFCVALASMVCKYLREVLMSEFNSFWQEKVPGLEPTAGYPLDARRFFEAIKPALKKLGIARECIWRER
jgi:ribonuclease HII